MRDTLRGEQWLNNTLIFGACYAEAHETDGTGPEEAASAVRTESSSVEPTTAETPDSSGSSLGRPGAVGTWTVAGAIMVIAAVNSVSSILVLA